MEEADVTHHFRDQRGAAQLRSVIDVAPRSPFLRHVNRRYGFRAGAKKKFNCPVLVVCLFVCLFSFLSHCGYLWVEYVQ